ncbi:MAG: anhydro-N-acetylmuramic acid kinase [Pseudomonadota bacterium]
MTKDQPLWALGAMSGTSLDGVDAAMLRTDGVALFEFGANNYRTYTDVERAVIRLGFGKLDGPEIAAAAEIVETAHAEVLDGFEGAEVIGFHGQTLTHLPDRGVTLQAGNGDVLAKALGTPVVWDFRSADMELGGHGAPLAPFYHFALARFMGADAPLVFLNLGGVGNLTWVDPGAPAAETPGACLAFDTGPANAVMDDLVLQRLAQRYDEDGRLAQSGTVDQAVLAGMMRASYLSKIPPKSLDRNDFSDWSDQVSHLDSADALATLAAGTAAAVARAIEHCPAVPQRVLVTGGGRKNPVVMAELAERLMCRVEPVEVVGFDGDMLEAQAFAYLAVRVLRGYPTSAPGTTGVAAPVGGGKISRP